MWSSLAWCKALSRLHLLCIGALMPANIRVGIYMCLRLAAARACFNRHIWEKNKKGKTANLIPSFRAVKWMSKLGFIRCSFHLYSKLFTKFKIFRKVLPFYLVLNSKCSVRGGTLFKEDFDWLNFSLKATNLWLLFCLCVETSHLVLYLR